MNSEQLFTQLRFKSFVRCIISDPYKKSQSLKKIDIVPKTIKKQQIYHVTFYIDQKVTHQNLPIEELYLFLQPYFFEFKQAQLTLKDQEYHIFFNKGQEKIITNSKIAIPPSLAHDKKKKYLLEEGKPILFFQKLKIMDDQGRVNPSKYPKFRQINRYLEFIKDVLPLFPKESPITVLDFGCGKSYLTFAAYYYLNTILGYKVKMVGLDLKEDVIKFCNDVAKACKMTNLRFEVGDIGSYPSNQPIDMVISLHACDIATDFALAKAVFSQAKVIFAVPCCQHELHDQIQSKTLPFLLDQGIIKERMSALITDVARLHLLETLGYKTQIIEFIETEHTPKNLLIRAYKGADKSLVAWQQYQQLKQEFGFKHTFEKEVASLLPKSK